MREIQGDRLEQSRIRLERDIDNNIPSPPSMSSADTPPDDHDHDDVSSVDFARHNSYPHASFHSFEHLSHLDSDFYSRHGDDDSIALDPDLGQTMSTAAHHASALTLSAGLRGRTSYNHTTGRASPSGVEFDPERPLQDILDNKIANAISLFDATGGSKSKSAKSVKHDETRSLPTYDPVIVDSTTELDRFLRTGHQHHHPASRQAYPYVTRSHSQPSPGASEASDSDSSAPRLSQALGQQFSPKRPRSAPISTQQYYQPSRPQNHTLGRTVHPPKVKTNKSQPGPSNLNPARHSTLGRKPTDSQLSKAVRNIGRDEAQSRLLSHDENQKINDATPRPHRHGLFPSAPVAGLAKRLPFSNIVNKELGDTRPKDRTLTSARVHLPDVTGLTSAVQSPVKGGDGYAAADVGHPSLAADLLPVLDALQTRLQTLERENGVSRRRVTELEFELEECKAEVARERTRIRERDHEERKERERERERDARGKLREQERRYHEVVEEKKALEALVSTLRTHLTRLTSELASHKSLVEDLRADAYAARETQAEVEALRAEVERLAGEVERLKEIVEEGLRERRRGRVENSSGDMNVAERDETTVPAQLGIDLTYVTAPLSRGEEREEPMTLEDLEPEHEEEQEQERESETGHRWDAEPVHSHSRRFIDESELARVELDMRERRSRRSGSSSGGSSQMNASRDRSLEHDPVPDFAANVQDENPSPKSYVPRQTVQTSELSNYGSSRRNESSPKQPAVATTPFPQIRGSRMERLFFSAPEHNARTCSVCHRRKRGGEHRRVKDEGYHGGDDEETVRTYFRNQAKRGNVREKRNGPDYEFDGDGDRLPPQTVLARVVRELEDDFSHYKAIYLELAEQYGVIDAASNVAKRNVLADHLRDVIDTLEQKGDQIASLYDLLNFQDKPLPRGVPSRPKYATAFA